MFMVLLVVLTVVIPIATFLLWNQWYLTMHASMILVATELTKRPDNYFVLTSPDPYTLEAIQNPDMHIKVTFVEEDKVTFLDQVEEHDTPNVEFEEKYYHINVMVDLIVPFLQLILLAEITGLVVCWYVVIHKYRRKPQQKNDRKDSPDASIQTNWFQVVIFIEYVYQPR